MKNKSKGSNLFTVMIGTLMSMVLCACLLFGTTYAWFTASVESSANIIKTGSFNVNTYIGSLGTTRDGFTRKLDEKNNFKVFDVSSLAPGDAHNSKIVYLMVDNASEYPINVQIEIGATEGADNSSSLADALNMYYLPAPVGGTFENELTISDMIASGSAGGAAYSMTELLQNPEEGKAKVGWFTEPIYIPALTKQIIAIGVKLADDEYSTPDVSVTFDLTIIATQTN